MERLQLLARVQPVQQRHADVDDNHVRPQLARRLQQERAAAPGTVPTTSNSAAAGASTLARQHVIVGEQDSGAFHRGLAQGPRFLTRRARLSGLTEGGDFEAFRRDQHVDSRSTGGR